MNFMGMGLAELAVIMVVAFLVLGPNRTINMVRTAGKILADLRRTFNDVAAAVSLEEKGQAASSLESRPVDSRPPGSRPVAQPQPPQEESTPVDSVPQDSVPQDLVPEDQTGPAASTKNGDE